MTSSFLNSVTLADLSSALGACAAYMYTESPVAATSVFTTLVLTSYYLRPTAKKLHDVAILVVCKKDWDGMGDCHHALNVSEFLAKNFPGSQIKLLSNGADEVSAFKKMGHEIGLASAYESTQTSTLAIQLPVPQEELPRAVAEKNDTLFIGEYSFVGCKSSQAKSGNYKSSGCGEGELGVFIEDQEFFDQGQARGPGQNYEMLNELVGKHFPDTDISKDQIYFGYTGCWYGAQRFLSVVSSVSHIEGNSKDITVFVPGGRLLGDEANGRLLQTLGDPVFLDFLKENRVSTLEVYSHKIRTIFEIDRKKGAADPRKSLKLVLPGAVPQNDVMSFHLHSQPLTMVTGDSSLTKALTLGIPTLYECPGHKTKSHANFSKIGPEGARNLLEAGVFVNGDSDDYRGYSKKVAELVKGRVPALHNDFKVMAERLKENHNYEEKLTALVQQWILNGNLS